jgi:hypothetical protein
VITSDWPTPTAGDNEGIYDPVNHGFLVTESDPDTIIFLDRVNRGSVTLRSIVEDVCDQAGFTIADDIDATALTDIVEGFVISGRQQASGPIESLSRLYDFDAREEDFIIDFIKGGGASAFTIDEDDLGVESGNLGREVKLERERIDEREIPRIVEINFSDVDFDYQSGTQRWQRIQEATNSEKKISFSVGLSETNTNVLAMAERVGQKAWLERFNYQTPVGPKHYRISPGDVGTIVIGGVSLLVKVLSANLGDNGVYQIAAVSENLEGHTTAGNTGSGSGDFPAQDVGGTALVNLYTIDNPIILDSQDGIGAMLASGRIGSGDFPGASVFFSTDNVNFTVVQSIQSNEEVTHGVATTSLPSASHTIWDRVNTVTIDPFNGTLESATEEEVLNGANFALLGDEYIQFANATLNGDGTYTLDTLLRGRKGTEWAISNHGNPERFVLMTTGTIFNHALSDSLINSTAYYKAVAFQQGFETGTLKQLGYQANAKKPYAVVEVEGVFGGSPSDIPMSWVRRTRVGGEWVDGTGTVPLGEESEEYILEILDTGSPDVVLRTTGTLTSPSYTYTEADQITDFGAPVSSVTVRIYQISATVGRGFPSTKLLAA